MDYDKPVATPADKQAAHRKRFEAGQRMFELLQERTVDETGITPEHDEVLRKARAEVWRAESRALRLDPNLRHVPRDLAPPPDFED